jgi:D-sedoheptulose 7-phosphate isomerase
MSRNFVSSSHLVGHLRALLALEREAPRMDAWGAEIARHLASGSRLLAAGNGGSAAQAQHLTAELVGRYQGERPAFSAIALHADTSATTAIGNDYGFDHVFARQVEAHGRPGDLLLLLSTSGRSENLLAAARTAHRLGLRTLALTGPAPNPLRDLCDEAISIDHEKAAIVQEVHLVAVHLICEAFDAAIRESGARVQPQPRVMRSAG